LRTGIQDHLPSIEWTVNRLGDLVGRCHQDRYVDRRAAYDAWRVAVRATPTHTRMHYKTCHTAVANLVRGDHTVIVQIRLDVLPGEDPTDAEAGDW
jgi:hypothetical protein